MNTPRNVLRSLLFLLLLTLPLGCRGAGPDPVDPVLLAFLSAARSAHHKADIAEGAEDPAAAIAALDGLVSAPRPGRGAEPPEVAEVLADTRARLAELRSHRGEFDAALGDVDAGLTLVPGVSYFRGHLFEVRGLVHERRAEARRAAGNGAAAKEDERAAIEAFDQAITIQSAVVERALPDAGL